MQKLAKHLKNPSTSIVNTKKINEYCRLKKSSTCPHWQKKICKNPPICAYLLSSRVFSAKTLFQFWQNLLNQWLNIGVELFHTSSPFGFSIRIVMKRMNRRKSSKFLRHQLI